MFVFFLLLITKHFPASVLYGNPITNVEFLIPRLIYAICDSIPNHLISALIWENLIACQQLIYVMINR